LQPERLSGTEVKADDLLNTAPCGFLSFADDGVVTLANATLLEMLGYRHEDVVGRHIEQLFNVGTRIFYQTHFFPLLRLHGRAEEVFLLMQNRSGSPVGMLTFARRRQTDATHYDCVLVPVVERTKYEDELLRQKRELKRANDLLEEQAVELELQQQQAEELRMAADEANKAKSSFLAMMSHELRTPLNAIGGYLQILQLGIAGPISDAQRDILARLEKSSHHLLRLINEVLDLARIESGQLQFDIRPANLETIVKSVLPIAEPLFTAKQITFSVDVPSDIAVTADDEKVSQVILNLLGNAAKFTNENGRVRLFAEKTAGGEVHLHVEDNGIGISPHQLEAIFEPFVQVDSSRTRTAEGSGLGLAISRDLARGMGGNLIVKSKVGSGSTFTFIMVGA
jgi:PAS domain S-box-containing protein